MLHLSKTSLTTFFAVLGLTCAHSARSETPPALDRVSIWLGGYYANTDIDFSAQSNRYNLSTGKLKYDVGNVALPRARLDMLIGDSQGLSFDYYRFKRSRVENLNEPVTIDGNSFDVGASIKGRFEVDFGTAAYRWWLGGGDDVFGIGLGAAYYKVQADLSAQVDAAGQSIVGNANYSDDAVAPLLTLGWRHAFSEDLRIYVDASGVKKNGGNLAGHIYNGAVGVEWFPMRNVGVGVEYSVTRIRLEADRSNYNADLDMKLRGPAAYLRMRF